MTQLIKREKQPRLIQGVIAKCVDGKWTDGDGLPLPSEMLVIGMTRALICRNKENEWLDVIVDQPDKPLADPDELNAQIPVQEWGVDLNGAPRPPWALNYAVYLLDVETGNDYTYLNQTFGAMLAYERLERRIERIRYLRDNDNIAPIVKLDSAPMAIKRLGNAIKQRPEFAHVDWRDFGEGGGGVLLQPPRGDGSGSSAPLIEHQKAELALATPAKPAPTTPAKPTSSTSTKKKVGRDVKPTTISEEINDSLPDDLAPPINPSKAG